MTLEELNTHLQNDYNRMVESDFEFAKMISRSWKVPIHKFFIVSSEKWTCYKYIIKFFQDMDEEDYDNDYKKLFNQIRVVQDILFGIYWWLQKSSVNFLDTKKLAKGIRTWLILEQIA